MRGPRTSHPTRVRVSRRTRPGYGAGRPCGTTISLGDGQQFEVLGAFWEAMEAQADMLQLRGVGHSWGMAGRTFKYLIGAPVEHAWNASNIARLDGLRTAHTSSVVLPDTGWHSHRCAPADIASMYAAIWQEGDLLYEVEHFAEDGTFVTDVIYQD